MFQAKSSSLYGGMRDVMSHAAGKSIASAIAPSGWPFKEIDSRDHAASARQSIAIRDSPAARAS